MKDNRVVKTLLKYDCNLIDAAEELGMTKEETIKKYHTDISFGNRVNKAVQIYDKYFTLDSSVSYDVVKEEYKERLLRGSWEFILKTLETRKNIPQDIKDGELVGGTVVYVVKTETGLKELSINFNV